MAAIEGFDAADLREGNGSLRRMKDGEMKLGEGMPLVLTSRRPIDPLYLGTNAKQLPNVSRQNAGIFA